MEIYCAASLTWAEFTETWWYYYDWYLKTKLFNNRAELQYAIENCIEDDYFMDNPLSDWLYRKDELPWSFFWQFDAHRQGIMLSRLLELNSETYSVYTQWLQLKGVNYLSL